MEAPRRLDFRTDSFDFVFQSTVFTSILDSEVRKEVAGEMLRVLKPGGVILWYDFHVNNPRNPDVLRSPEKKRFSDSFQAARFSSEESLWRHPLLVGLLAVPGLGAICSRRSHGCVLTTSASSKNERRHTETGRKASCKSVRHP